MQGEQQTTTSRKRPAGDEPADNKKKRRRMRQRELDIQGMDSATAPGFGSVYDHEARARYLWCAGCIGEFVAEDDPDKTCNFTFSKAGLAPCGPACFALLCACCRFGLRYDGGLEEEELPRHSRGCEASRLWSRLVGKFGDPGLEYGEVTRRQVAAALQEE